MKYDQFRGKTEELSEKMPEVDEKIDEIQGKQSVLDEVEQQEYDDDIEDAMSLIHGRLSEEDDSAQAEKQELVRQKEELKQDIQDAIEENQQAINQMRQLSDTRYGGQFAEAEQAAWERIRQLDSLMEDLDGVDSQSPDSGKAVSGIISRMKTILGISDSQPSAVSQPADTHGGPSQLYKHLTNMFTTRQVNYNPIQRSGTVRTGQEIIDSISGGDLTEGSCSSVAFAYAGNKAGYNVLDFRGGTSREMFSSRSIVRQIAGLSGVRSTIIEGRNDISCANKLLKTMAPGKEYYLATGCHAAIVRRSGSGYEYLELQHPTSNGWRALDNQVLYNRFDCGFFGPKLSNFLIDVDSLSGSTDFLSLLGYLNTDGASQGKGIYGYVR